MAAGDDGAEVIHHQQTADAVGGSRAAPQHDRQNQAVPRHYADLSGGKEQQLERQRDTVRQMQWKCWGTQINSTNTTVKKWPRKLHSDSLTVLPDENIFITLMQKILQIQHCHKADLFINHTVEWCF